METIKDAVLYFLSFKSYVILPVIILILAMVFRIKTEKAIRSALTIGIGFIGIFILIDYFVAIIHPVVKALIDRTGLHVNVLDVGWPPLAAITWSFSLAPLMLLLIIATNVAMLLLKLTRTVNIDIWNYWHFICAGALVSNLTHNVWLSMGAVVTCCVITLKLADWSAPAVHAFSHLQGISIPTLSATTYFPLGVLGNQLLERIPGVRKINVNPEKLKDKIGLASEPMLIGFVIGILLGIGGGYDIRGILELAFGFAAVIYILPLICNIVGSSLIPISEGMKAFIKRKLPGLGETYIALDVAVLVGLPSVVVTAILLIPVALVLAFILPGVNFIPLGDLVSIMGTVALVCAATRGNLFRSFLIGIPILIMNLYIASGMAASYTSLAHSVNYKPSGYEGDFTSFLDGGNAFRVWVFQLFSGKGWALLLVPVVIGLLYFTRRIIRIKKNSSE